MCARPVASGPVLIAALVLASAGRVDPPPVLVSAVFADGFAPADGDEAVQLWNVSGAPVDLGGWTLGDGEGAAGFPPGARLPAGAWWWIAREGDAFARSFGHAPDWVWGGGGPRRLATTGGGPALANGGDEVALRAADGRPVDAVVYGGGASAAGWVGPAVRAYAGGAVGAAHQVLYRKLSPAAGGPVPDTDRAVDWASDAGDVALGRRARFPGWDLEGALRPTVARDRGRLEVAVAPDALYGFLRRHLAAARRSIDLMAYTLDQPAVAEVLVDRLEAGVRVRLLLDGSPAGGIDPNERWCAARVAAAGGAVYWMDDGGPVRRRYRSAHAKLAVVDGRTVLVGSENPGLGSAPGDDLADGTLGRRGVFVATDMPAVVAWASDLVARDLDAGAHADLRPFQARDPARGAPAPDFHPARDGGGAGYRPVAPEPLVVDGAFDLELVTAPENALAPDAGLLGLVARAGPGDEVLVEQLDEPRWWGDGEGEGAAAANPRVAAYLAAARRGARVRVLLDAYFDDPAEPSANAATAGFLNAVGRGEALDLEARVGNPTGLGLHNKMVLVAAGAARWSHVGSLNGSEAASKLNREAALQVESAAVHAYLARVFAWDWAASGANAIHLPWAGAVDGTGRRAAAHPASLTKLSAHAAVRRSGDRAAAND